MGAQVIEAYIASGEPMDKAGAYGIQGVGGSFVSGITGCYFSVMGFPIHRFSAEVRRARCSTHSRKRSTLVFALRAFRGRLNILAKIIKCTSLLRVVCYS